MTQSIKVLPIYGIASRLKAITGVGLNNVCAGVFICCGLQAVRPRNTDAEAAVCWRGQRRSVERQTDPPHTHSIAIYNRYSKLPSSEDNHKFSAVIVSEFERDSCSFRMAVAAVRTWRVILIII